MIAHTADAGIEATAPSLPELLEEAAAALAELSSELVDAAEPSCWVEVTLDGDDLAGLAYAWLNELISLADIHHGGVVATSVEAVEGPPAERRPGRASSLAGPWRLRGRIGIKRYAEPGIVPLRQAKSATYHRLAVERTGRRWALHAYVDL
jgi:SHS2 domain-containing protein